MALSTASHGGNRKEQVTKPHALSLSSGQGDTCGLSPALDSSLSLLPIGKSGEAVPARTAVLSNGARDGEEPLGLAS